MLQLGSVRPFDFDGKQMEANYAFQRQVRMIRLGAVGPMCGL